MGVGTSSGVQTPAQPGVILRERKNFPIIPPRLLGLSIEKLDAERERVSSAHSAELRSFLPNGDTEERLEKLIFVYDAAREAVRRRQEASVVR